MVPHLACLSVFEILDRMIMIEIFYLVHYLFLFKLFAISFTQQLLRDILKPDESKTKFKKTIVCMKEQSYLFFRACYQL